VIHVSRVQQHVILVGHVILVRHVVPVAILVRHVKRVTERVLHVIPATVVVVVVGQVGQTHQVVLAVLVQERVVLQRQESAGQLTHVVMALGQVGQM